MLSEPRRNPKPVGLIYMEPFVRGQWTGFLDLEMRNKAADLLALEAEAGLEEYLARWAQVERLGSD